MLKQVPGRPALTALAAFAAVLLLAFLYVSLNGESGDGGGIVSNAPAQTATATPAQVTDGATPATAVATPTPTPAVLPDATIVYGTPPPRSPAPDRPPTPPPTPFPNPTTIDTDGDGEPDTETNLHECVAAGNCDCDSFETYDEALAAFQALPDDPFKLDPDKDGLPCEQAAYAPR